MIGSLQGTLISVDDQIATIACQGVGYEVYVTPKLQKHLLAKLGDRCSVFIYTHVREDQLNLFGFEQICEKRLFLKLLSVSGVGAKTALNMFATLSYDSLLNAIVQKDIDTIATCSGIGKKTAQRIAIELSDRLADLAASSLGVNAATLDQNASNQPSAEVISALSNLGYRREHILDALSQIKDDQPLNFERSFKECLKILSQ